MDQLASNFIDYVPRVMGALSIIVVGLVLGIIARPGATFVLRRLRFDRACDRIGVSALMRDSGIQSTPSRFGGMVVFYAILLFAVLAALGPLGLTFLAETLNQIILYTPRILAAALILLLGAPAARVVAELAGRGLSEVGVSRPEYLKSIVRFGVVFVAAVLAAGVLGIQATILIVVAIIGLGAVALTASLALGLGLRQLSQNVAAGRYISEGLEEGDDISVNGISGTVERIGHAMTTIRDPENGQTYLLPNSHFLDHAVTKRESSRQPEE